ncbi:ABC transporter permease [Sulfodiicoccus acidiphilus]|uniref:ABC transporter permease n=1 Tax=Sulfodiicoccus acidiphilus TaxID=1670455 RepID=A0A348B5J1_9CREN|nr:sugar ABC transporter permease [Sulfodiicoccus acidiphilus]BBD73443.1 ABC transporter permease [Sulfodiicoccus acidiphilus]GGT98503.1 ABC transporter permease [Sulfodiicoccus acidiphilus]
MGREKVPREEKLTAYAFVLPSILLVTIFLLFPAVYSFVISLLHYDLLFHVVYFVGLRNYEQVASSGLFWLSMLHALEYTAVVVTTQTFLAFGMAYLFNSRGVLTRITRAVVFVPAVTSSAVMSVLFIWVFSPQGLLNSFLGLFGVRGPNWLFSTTWAFPAIMALNVFSTAPYFMVMYIAGFQAIPRSIIEAAEIDGVRGAFRKMRYIYFPLLKFTTLLVVILGVIGSMQLFDQVYIMTDGGPGTSTYVPLIYIYDQAFVFNNFGAAAAASFILFVIIMVLTVLQRRFIGEGRWT